MNTYKTPEYNTYVHSKQWAIRRSNYFINHEKRCNACGSRTKIHLHHLVYWRLGFELDEDLVPLCKNCHNLVHTLCQKELIDICEATRRVMVHKGVLNPKVTYLKRSRKKNPNRRKNFKVHPSSIR